MLIPSDLLPILALGISTVTILHGGNFEGLVNLVCLNETNL
jgi:hypothetical protein